MSPAERRFWDFAYARRVLRHRQRPSIEPWPGRVQVAVQAAAALRANEVVTICSDAPPLGADRTRTVEVPFLGRQARLLPGVVTLARLTGAPVLMAFMHRLADYRHQVLEISPPVPMDGETETAFGRCAAAMDAAIRTSPAHWVFWFEPDDLARLGLLPSAPPTGTAAVSRQPADGQPALPPWRCELELHADMSQRSHKLPEHLGSFSTSNCSSVASENYLEHRGFFRPV